MAELVFYASVPFEVRLKVTERFAENFTDGLASADEEAIVEERVMYLFKQQSKEIEDMEFAHMIRDEDEGKY